MSEILNLHTLIAFALGVLLAAYVKALVGKLKGSA